MTTAPAIVTGWRARLLAVAAILATTGFVATIAIATAAGMLIVLPIAIGVGLVAALWPSARAGLSVSTPSAPGSMKTVAPIARTSKTTSTSLLTKANSYMHDQSRRWSA